MTSSKYITKKVFEGQMKKALARIRTGLYILKTKEGYVIPDMSEKVFIREEVVKELFWRGLIVKVSDNRWDGV